MMAFGMGVFEPVDMLCGAGNKFVAEAKRQLYGRCGIDLLAGPTEIMVIADDSADAALVACDLLGQAEHDPNSGVALICFSQDFARRCDGELNRQLEVLPTRDVAALSWRDNGKIYIAESREEAVALADDYAPEHLEIQTADPIIISRTSAITARCSSARRPPWPMATSASAPTTSFPPAALRAIRAACG